MNYECVRYNSSAPEATANGFMSMQHALWSRVARGGGNRSGFYHTLCCQLRYHAPQLRAEQAPISNSQDDENGPPATAPTATATVAMQIHEGLATALTIYVETTMT